MKGEGATSPFDNSECLSAINMIILNSKKIKKNFKEMLDQYQNQEFYGPFECPHCHHEKFEKWGSYNINLKIIFQIACQNNFQIYK